MQTYEERQVVSYQCAGESYSPGCVELTQWCGNVFLDDEKSIKRSHGEYPWQARARGPMWHVLGFFEYCVCLIPVCHLSEIFRGTEHVFHASLHVEECM